MNDIIINGTEIKQRIVSEINNARRCIYLAMAWFTDKDIASSIIEAKKRNVAIDIILSSNNQNEPVKQMLTAANISVHAFDTGDERGLMHHKFCLIDNLISINGSYNYSYNASNNNIENIHISDNPSVYQQLLSEFERIKHNIDNNIAVNANPSIRENHIEPHRNQMAQFQEINSTSFHDQLYNLVYSSAQISTAEYKKKGYQKSQESGGNINIFESEYQNIKEEIRVYATDDSLLSKKNILLANITNAFENKKAELEYSKQMDLASATKNVDIEKRQLTEKISTIKQDKSILELGNQNTGEKGLLQLNKEIEKNRLEIKALEQSFVTKRFWSVGTCLVTLCLAIFCVYLSLFFASAVYKVLFEGNAIRNSLEAGITPGLPQLVDANAIVKIFNQQGMLFGFIATVFFLFPVLLSNIRILGSHKKWLNNLLFWVGLLIFDIAVAAMIAFNTDEIKSLLVGRETQLQFLEVVTRVEFWMIFVFGMMPLIITHYLINFLTNAYAKSRPDLVDAEKAKKARLLNEEMIDLVSVKESINNNIKEKDNAITEIRENLINREKELISFVNQTEQKYNELLKPLKTTFDDFTAQITSGKIFTHQILDSVVSAYKSGFIDFLPCYYSEGEVGKRVGKIEQVISTDR